MEAPHRTKTRQGSAAGTECSLRADASRRGLGCTVSGFGFRAQGLGFTVQGLVVPIDGFAIVLRKVIGFQKSFFQQASIV